MFMLRNQMNGSGSRRTRLALSALALVSVMALIAPTAVSAQTQIVTATPGSVNFGLTTTISVTAPASGSYTVEVVSPTGTTTSQALTFTSTGQVQTLVFGNATVGFNTVVNKVGTYNVFVLQGTTVVGTTSFYATNKLFITMDMVTGGTCYFINSDARGYKFIPRFYVYYASNPTLPLAAIAVPAPAAGASPTLIHDTNLTVSFTQPDNKTVTKASWDAGALLWRGIVQPAWNYTYVGSWNPTVTASDAAGNVGTFQYAGYPFAITTASLATNLQLTDVKTGSPIAAIYGGESIAISATIKYPTNAEPTSGFVTGLDSVNRGGVVNAVVGWGTWNVTTGTFGGGAANPGGVLGTVKLTNTNGINGTWTGQFTFASPLPTIPAGASFAVAITSADKANPPNTGLQVTNLGLAPTPAAGGGVVTTTTVTASGTTATVTVSGTQTITPSTLTSTATTTVTAATATTTVSGAISTVISTATSTITQVTQEIPTIVYAGLVVLLIVGLVMGLLLRMPRPSK